MPARHEIKQVFAWHTNPNKMPLSSKDLPLQIAFRLVCSYVKEDLRPKKKYFEIIKQSAHKASYSKPGKVSDKRPWISALFLECVINLSQQSTEVQVLHFSDT